jgi:hypothetical protein
MKTSASFQTEKSAQLLLIATVEFPESHVGIVHEICDFEMNVAGTVSKELPNIQHNISESMKLSP